MTINYDYLRQQFGIQYWKLYKDSENTIVFENIALLRVFVCVCGERGGEYGEQ